MVEDFIKLTTVTTGYERNTIYVRFSSIIGIGRMDEYTKIYTIDGDYCRVVETPEEIFTMVKKIKTND